jgi:acetyl esterase/lipase
VGQIGDSSVAKLWRRVKFCNAGDTGRPFFRQHAKIALPTLEAHIPLMKTAKRSIAALVIYFAAMAVAPFALNGVTSNGGTPAGAPTVCDYISGSLALPSCALAEPGSDDPSSGIPSIVTGSPSPAAQIAPAANQQPNVLHFVPRTRGPGPRNGQGGSNHRNSFPRANPSDVIEITPNSGMGAQTIEMPAKGTTVGGAGNGRGSDRSGAANGGGSANDAGTNVNREVTAVRQAEPGATLDISYVQDGGKSRSLDIRLPAGAEDAPAGKRYPLVVFVHGGGWSAGDKGSGPYRPLIRQGFAIASINYRLSGEASWPAQIYDCKAAIRWLRANGAKYHLDTKKIGVWGTSAGGHLVALLGTTNGVKSLEGNEGNLKQSSEVQAVCDWFGPTDFVLMENRAKAPQQGIIKFLGGTNLELAKAASPMTYVSSKAPPFLIIHGDQDPLVPLAQSQIFNDALKKAGVDTTLRVVEGGGHGKSFTAAETAAVIEFFKQQLR